MPEHDPFFHRALLFVGTAVAYGLLRLYILAVMGVPYTVYWLAIDLLMVVAFIIMYVVTE